MSQVLVSLSACPSLRSLRVATLAVPLALATWAACAEDTLKVAIGQMETWTNQAPTLGQRVGIFRKHGIVLENFGTQGGGETMQAVIAGAADIGIGIGTVGAMRGFAKGAPIRIIAPSFTGAGDLYWYVRSDSAIKSLKDTSEKHTIAYSTSGSSTHNIVLAFVENLGAKAKPTPTGGQPGTLTQVMSGQIDVGWASPPFGLKEVQEGKTRILAVGNDVSSFRDQTIRVEIVNANTLKDRKDVILRFMRAYREAVEWLYSDPQAAKMYAAAIGAPENLVQQTIDKFQTKASKQLDHVSDVDAIMVDGVKLKFLEKPLTKEQLAELIQIPPR
jgi:NitT/TauT family transport system substrate-binding protein